MNNNEFCVLKQNEINQVSGGLLIVTWAILIASVLMVYGAGMGAAWKAGVL